jgi:hypothetical protein
MPGPAAFRFHDDCAGHSSFYQGKSAYAADRQCYRTGFGFTTTIGSNGKEKKAIEVIHGMP